MSKTLWDRSAGWDQKSGPFTLKRLAHKCGIAEDVSMSSISRDTEKA